MLDKKISIQKKKIKNAYIRIKASDDVRVTVPLYYTYSDIEAFVQKHQSWIEKKRNLFIAKEKELVIQAEEEDTMLLFGEKFRIQTSKFIGRTLYELDPQNKIIYTANALESNSTKTAYYVSIAKEYLTKRVSQLASLHGFSYHKVYIRSQKTKWGTCSSKKNIGLNYKLIKAPLFVSDYVILHELAHTKVMNHQKEFWALVERLCPDYKKAEIWLRQWGHSL